MPIDISFDAYFTFTLIGMTLLLLSATRISADVIMMSALTLLIISNVLTPQEALAGFANTGIMTIATLYIVSAGLKESGAVQYIAHRLLGQPSNTRNALLRLLIPTSLLSAVMNNTAVVSMMIPATQEWAQRISIPASRLLLPLSYASILGGTLTLIGTSTNLVVDGLLQQHRATSLGMFELSLLGIPLLLIGGLFLYMTGGKLLPDRQSVTDQLSDAREYMLEVTLLPGSTLTGKSISEAGLRNLTFSYLAEIERGPRLITAVAPSTELQAGDILRFVGAPEGARELRNIRGLQPASAAVDKLNIAHHARHLVEAVIGPDFPALDKTIKASRFRTQYKAVILSVSRQGDRLPGKLGEIVFQVGDTLLLEADENFVEQYRFRRDFLLISQINNSTPPDFSKAPVALALLAAMVLASASGLLSILEAALLAAGGMLLTRCCTVGKARRNIDISVLVVIAASFALGAAMMKSGAAEQIATWILPASVQSPWIALALIYLLTSTFTEMITNNAAAVLMFPIAMAVADQLGVNFLPFAIAIMFAASASFITPLGYQTNLMVYGPGGYRFLDYVKTGTPLSLIVALTAILLIPFIWSF